MNTHVTETTVTTIPSLHLTPGDGCGCVRTGAVSHPRCCSAPLRGTTHVNPLTSLARASLGAGSVSSLPAPGGASPRTVSDMRLHAEKGQAMTFRYTWSPQSGYVRRVYPHTSEHWSPTESPVARYLLYLSVLGIEDPTRFKRQRATDYYQQAISLREHSVTVAAKQDDDPAIIGRLARGELSPEDAEKALAKVAPKAAEVQEQTERTRQAFANATRMAYASAVLAIHDYGDKWLDVLRPLVQEAVAAEDQARWDKLHAFAASLRSPALGGLAMVATDETGTNEFGETWRYTVGRPDLYHEWRFARAERTHEATAPERVGTDVFVATRVTAGPHPSLTDMVQGGMSPGIYSAAEVIAITEAIVAKQESAQVNAEPARSRAAVT